MPCLMSSHQTQNPSLLTSSPGFFHNFLAYWQVVQTLIQVERAEKSGLSPGSHSLGTIPAASVGKLTFLLFPPYFFLGQFLFPSEVSQPCKNMQHYMALEIKCRSSGSKPFSYQSPLSLTHQWFLVFRNHLGHLIPCPINCPLEPYFPDCLPCYPFTFPLTLCMKCLSSPYSFPSPSDPSLLS